MKLGSLLTVTAALAALFGLGFTFMPTHTLALYALAGAAPPTAAHLLAAQYFGISLLGIGVIDWAARHAAESDARRAIVLGNLVNAAAGLILGLLAVLQGTVNAFGWLTVIIYGLLLIGFARARFGRDSAAVQAAA